MRNLIATDTNGRIYTAPQEILSRIQYDYSTCDDTVPTYFVDLTGLGETTWESGFEVRNGLCCDATVDDDCSRFIVKVDPSIVQIEIYDETAPSLGAEGLELFCSTSYIQGKYIYLAPNSYNWPYLSPEDYVFVFTICKPGKEKQNIIIKTWETEQEE